MATIHNQASRNEIASVVLMPGDPLRAKGIAEQYLEQAFQFNSTRNMLGYTGWYKKTRISVMGGGMGGPSTGIYAHELYRKYDVDTIIRVGSCGAFSEQIAMGDVLLVEESWSESTFAQTYDGYKDSWEYPSGELNAIIMRAAAEQGKQVRLAKIHSTDCFYRMDREANFKIREKYGCVAEEMESFALFHVARAAGKKAAALLTVSDHSITHEAISAEERQRTFEDMIEIALMAAKKETGE
ncbi:purine-nucleoside phosphorylase [Lacrimispora sp. 210928-DFI.3.58]|uniref:purine-nucleoside phosphorylase n=1 Tax=Lacrimispora sp. 210928-DFI.3.58 TaxID=2883214 RepID=UPI0015B65336|nr:purine-nucleoside phosphorylase [Lacrimispora sp. 210928-DFI.3.58]MCB7320665.1 purine-nucleoside phosphorylase [Lacrimispora sp. 210928-DFI.3.58]